ncbi:methicillin resistance protein FmtA [Bhargavaea cecembensis]|uniref:Methicillin resistance protein FmtA n=2 Tax=Bhargavaea cecembensis TaxID=394098 RepID=A0A165GIM9_9BACL|nr:methicillin resistance protein FmtA [Bhargavaea cecembensis]
MFFTLNLKPALSASDQQVLESTLSDYLKEHGEKAAGVAVIVINEDEVMNLIDGYADIKRQIPVDEETIFEWGSVSKLLIWISILQLEEAGLLDMNEDIATYLPQDFPLYNSTITLQHLMNHTAGFDDSYTDLVILNPTGKTSLRDALEAADVQHVYPPGQVVAYSNYGAGLAAYVVEEVSGMDFREYVQMHIFAPLQMTRTAIDPEQDDHQWVKEQRKKVQGYTGDLELIEPNNYVIPLYPAGSVMGVASDLQKLMQELLSGGALLFQQPHTIDSLFQPSLYYPDTNVPRIANGLFFLPSQSRQVFGHGGNTVAFSSSFYVDIQTRTGVLVMTNMAYESAYTLGIPNIVFGEYVHNDRPNTLEDSSEWKGIYEPARVPQHGFSKVYGLLLRSKAEPAGEHDLTMNGLYYLQAEPGVYLTKDDFSAYALDVYSGQPGNEKKLSSGQSDLLYIPLYQHLLEWGAIVLGALAALFSFVFMLFSVLRRIRKNRFLLMQHVLNILVALNIVWIGYQTVSITTYSAIQPFLTANLFYMAGSVVLSGFILFHMRYNQIDKRGTSIIIITVMTAVVLSGNILYWEFYL